MRVTIESKRELIDTCAERAVEIRRDLHRYPELGYEETRTSKVVSDELERLGIEHRAGLARGTGVLGFIPATTGDPAGAKTVGLRADMDALPILEATDLPYASANEGVMHACGHDGHTSILLGAAAALAGMAERPNNVVLVFQPAEEGGAGAKAMVEDGALDGSVLGRPVDVMHGLHGWPEIEAGVVAVRNGPMLASTDEFTFTINGQGGHAAYPHLCVDPIVISAKIIDALQTVASRLVAPTDSVVVTVGHIHAGEAVNVIPDRVVMGGTMRSLNDDVRRRAGERVRELVTGIALSMGGSADIDWHVGYPVTHNEPGATDRLRNVVRETFGESMLLERPTPTMGGEDFAYYSQVVPSSFCFLGLRPPERTSYPNLHTPGFDFNDGVVGKGIELMVGLGVSGVG
jgi:amidohydrolase